MLTRAPILALVGLVILACAGPAPAPQGDPAAAPPAAPPAGTTVVTVLYFDNHTNDPDWDVFGKGLADMMVTDLSGVEGLVVVERARLQALIDELSLQQSDFFDPATAAKVGKGLGATHAITGSIVAFEPEVRIDVRLVDVASFEVVMADKVAGPDDDFFALQEQLTDKFVTAFDKKRSSRESKSKLDDTSVLLEYAKGLDSSDRGDLESASKILGSVVTKAPDFGLAQDRYTDVMKRLKEARARRTGMLSAEQQALLTKADQVLQGDVTALSSRAAARWFGYRQVRGALFLKSATGLLKPLTTQTQPNQPLSEADRAAMRELLSQYLQNKLREIDEVRAWQARNGELPHWMVLDKDDKARAENLHLDLVTGVSPTNWLARDLVRIVIFGEYGAWLPSRPTLAELDPAVVPLVFAALDAALVDIPRYEQKQYIERETVRLIDIYGGTLAALGRKAEAIARWQSALDQFPTCSEYDNIERRISNSL